MTRIVLVALTLLLAGCTHEEWEGFKAWHEAWVAQGAWIDPGAAPVSTYYSTIHTPSGTLYGQTDCGSFSCTTSVRRK